MQQNPWGIIGNYKERNKNSFVFHKKPLYFCKSRNLSMYSERKPQFTAYKCELSNFRLGSCALLVRRHVQCSVCRRNAVVDSEVQKTLALPKVIDSLDIWVWIRVCPWCALEPFSLTNYFPLPKCSHVTFLWHCDSSFKKLGFLLASLLFFQTALPIFEVTAF